MKDFPDIEGWMVESDLKFLYRAASRVTENGVIVELGCWLGRSTCAIIRGAKTRNITVVDTWQGVGGEEPCPEVKRELRDFFEANMNMYAGFVPNIFEMTTVKASQLFEDRTVDFLFVDGDHTEEAFYNDLEVWIPKVKKSGLLAGHDWSLASVRNAFRKVFSAAKQPSLTLGDIWYIYN